jgi:hypothetical protein
MFLEVVFNAHELAAAGFGGRDELEEPLQDALEQAGLGQVTGGGSGSGFAIVDVEVADETQFDSALAVIRNTLRALNAPRSTKVKLYEPGAATFPIYE